MIYLASKSPRRRKLLTGIGLSFKVVDPDVSEYIPDDIPPHEAVQRLARRKADAVAADVSSDDIVIAADTVVVVDGRIIGKPEDRGDAFAMLTMLSGSWHEVYTGIAVTSGGVSQTGYEKTRVKFNELSEAEIEAYIESEEPFDKAGAYGIQQKGAMLVERIEGDYFNVVGLPLSRLRQMLLRFGIDLLEV